MREIIASAAVLFIGASMIALNLWAKRCIRLRGYGEEFTIPMHLTLMEISFSERPTLIYKATWSDPLHPGEVTETIGVYDIYSFGQSDTGLMGG